VLWLCLGFRVVYAAVEWVWGFWAVTRLVWCRGADVFASLFCCIPFSSPTSISVLKSTKPLHAQSTNPNACAPQHQVVEFLHDQALQSDGVDGFKLVGAAVSDQRNMLSTIMEQGGALCFGFCTDVRSALRGCLINAALAGCLPRRSPAAAKPQPATRTHAPTPTPATAATAEGIDEILEEDEDQEDLVTHQGARRLAAGVRRAPGSLAVASGAHAGRYNAFARGTGGGRGRGGKRPRTQAELERRDKNKKMRSKLAG